jgi:hypothetical protein
MRVAGQVVVLVLALLAWFGALGSSGVMALSMLPGAAFVIAGLAAWSLRPHNRLGPLMGIAGLGMLLEGSGSSVPDPNKAVPIRPKGGTFRPLRGRSHWYRDMHGTWFVGTDGSIWLYNENREFMKVAVVPPPPSRPTVGYDFGAPRPAVPNTRVWNIAGPCM